MSWQAVAVKDFEDAVRSWVLWISIAVMSLFMVLFVYLFDFLNDAQTGTGGGGAELTATDFSFFVQGAIVLVFPAVALLAGIKSITRERESGSIKILLSLPHARWEVLAGKLLGRTAVVGIGVVISFVIAALAGLVFFDQFALLPYLAFAVLTMVYVLAFVSLSVGLSAALPSDTMATILAFVIYVLINIVWDFIPNAINLVLNDQFLFSPPGSQPDWAILITQLNPNGAYGRASTGLLNWVSSEPSQIRAIGDVPAYLGWGGALATLLLWIVVPMAIAYWRFDNAELS